MFLTYHSILALCPVRPTTPNLIVCQRIRELGLWAPCRPLFRTNNRLSVVRRRRGFRAGCKVRLQRLINSPSVSAVSGHIQKSATFGCLNIQSAINKFDDVIDLFRQQDLTALCLTETWLDSDSPVINRLRHAGYSVVDRPRPRVCHDISVNHGGVAIITAPGMSLAPLPVGLQPTTFEVTACYIINRHQVAVIAIYRPGSQPVTVSFFEELSKLLEQVVVLSVPVFVVGDFNIRLDRPDDSHTLQLHLTFDSYGFCVSKSGPTHRRGGTLDIVASRTPVSLSVIDVDYSDHHLVCWPVVLSRPGDIQTFPVTIRSWRQLDLDVFRELLAESSICQPHMWPTDVDTAASLFNDVIVRILDDILPISVIQRRPRPTDPWFDKECRSAKRLTRRLERAASAAARHAGRSAESAAAALTARVTWFDQRRAYRRLRDRKRTSFWSNEFQSSTDPRHIWSTVDRLLGRGHRSDVSVSSDVLSDYFVDKVERIRASTSDAPQPTFSTVPDGVRLEAFSPFTVLEIEAAIARLPNKSSAADPLPTNLLKSVADLLSPFLTYLFNLSVDSSRFPACFKDAFLTPILKKAGLPETEPSSFRPISNLPVISKLLERLVAKQLVAFVEGNHLLPCTQSGFRRGHSTETAITKILSDLLGMVDRGDTAILALLDLSAAFDTVDYDILLKRLSTSFGICGQALDWFQSYLTGRTQSVRCGTSNSAAVPIRCGVPQGSVLGPILFVLYTADLPSIVTPFGLSVHQYADDSQVYGSCRPDQTSTLADTLAQCTSAINNWMRSNRLQLNADKTDIMWCTSARRTPHLPTDPVCIAGVDVQPVTTVRNLGVLIDNDLSATSHIRMVTARCFAALRQLRQLRRYVSDDCFRSLVVALIHSRLDYGNVVLVGLPAFRQRLLQSVLNAAARLTFRLRRYDHVTDVLAILHWLRFPERIDYKLALMTYRSLNGFAPSYMQVFCRVADKPNPRRLRSSASGSLVVPAHRLSTVGRRSFPVAAAIMWNMLPADIQFSPSLSIFRSRLKTFLFPRSFPDIIV
jgi:hypothetical protein